MAIEEPKTDYYRLFYHTSSLAIANNHFELLKKPEREQLVDRIKQKEPIQFITNIYHPHNQMQRPSIQTHP